MSEVEKKLQDMGIILPDVPKPAASYIPAVQTGKLVYTSGQASKKDGTLVYKGKLGKDLTVEEGYEAAKISIINCLAILKGHLGSLDLIKIFGKKGRHARSAIGTNILPFGTPVEIEMIVEVEEEEI